MTKKILITGASGLVGRHCMDVFTQDTTWTTLGLAFSRAGDHFRKVDLTDRNQVTSVLKEFKPNVILHSAVERRIDVVEKHPDKMRGINIDATKYICDVANEIGAYVLFLSTVYVFDGTKPPYSPGDQVNPLNKYGASKAEGEKIVMESNAGNIVLRVPILYGNVESIEESLITMFFPQVKNTEKPVELNHVQRRNPTSCQDLAKAIKILVDSREKNSELTGNFHWSGNETMTKYDMGITMAELYGIPTQHIVADTKPAPGAPRPHDCTLDCSRLEELGATTRTPFRVGIKEVLDKFYS